MANVKKSDSGVKGAILVDRQEIMVKLPSNWKSLLEKNYLLLEDFSGVVMAFNLAKMDNVREVTDTEWTNWITRFNLYQSEKAKELKKIQSGGIVGTGV